MNCIHSKNKQLLLPLRSAMYDFEEGSVQQELEKLIASDAKIRMPFPFKDLIGSEAFFETCYAPLFRSFPDLERRDWIVMAGSTEQNNHWVGCAGHYSGTFIEPWLDIPATGHLAHMRFHEFFRFKEGKIVEIQAIWDIPELMMQANAWPMAPSLGLEYHVPGPATLDGQVKGPWNEERSKKSCNLIIEMLDHMKRHPSKGGAEVMQMQKFWHPRMNWYGPAGIGTGRGIAGFRNWHQIPFLNAMPDRGKLTSYDKKDGWGEDIFYHFFSENEYVAVTGWPNMKQTISHDGWLGIAPVNKVITLRSLDFWRLEHGKIRENWVLVDLLDIYNQIGVNVFSRLKEFNKANTKGVYQ